MFGLLFVDKNGSAYFRKSPVCRGFFFESRITTDSERAWLKVNIPALTAGNTQNLLTLRTNDNCCFRSATTTKSAGRNSADNVLTKRQWLRSTSRER